MAKNPIEFGRLNQKMGRKKPPRYPDDPAPRPKPKIPNRMAPSKKPAPRYTPRPKSTAEKILTGNPFNSKQVGTVLKGAAGVAKRIDSGKKVVDRAIVSGAKNATKFVLGSATRGNGMAKKAIRSIDDPMKYLTPSKRTPQKRKPNGGRTELTLERRYPKPPKGEGIRKPAIRPTLPKRPPSKDAKPAPRQYLKDNGGGTPKPKRRPNSEGKTIKAGDPRLDKYHAVWKFDGSGKGGRPIPRPRPRPTKTGPSKGSDGRAYPKAKVPKMQILPAYPKDKKPKITTLPYKPKPRKKTLY